MWRCAEKSLPEWPFDDNDADKSISEDTMAGWWAELLPRVSLAGRTNQPWSVKMTRMNFGNSFAGPQMCHFGQIGAKKESNSQHKEILRYLTFRASLPCRQILLQRHFHCFRTHAVQGSTMQYSASDDENLFLRNIWQWCGIYDNDVEKYLRQDTMVLWWGPRSSHQVPPTQQQDDGILRWRKKFNIWSVKKMPWVDA